MSHFIWMKQCLMMRFFIKINFQEMMSFHYPFLIFYSVSTGRFDSTSTNAEFLWWYMECLSINSFTKDLTTTLIFRLKLWSTQSTRKCWHNDSYVFNIFCCDDFIFVLDLVWIESHYRLIKAQAYVEKLIDLFGERYTYTGMNPVLFYFSDRHSLHFNF